MRRKYLLLLSVAGFILSLDQFSKYLVLAIFDTQPLSLIPGFLQLKVARSAGVAGGWFQRNPASLQDLLTWGVPVLALLLIVLIFVKLQDGKIQTSLALTLILSGAIGNLIDRFQYNGVIDFLSFHLGNWVQFPPLNLADISILTGASIIFLNTLKGSAGLGRAH